jgi:hypothetical protein
MAFATEMIPPMACLLNKKIKDYKFAPLVEDDVAIYTVDSDVWQPVNIGKNCHIIDSMCPPVDRIISMFEIAEKRNCHMIVALTKNQIFHTPGSDGGDNGFELVYWPSLVDKCNLLKFSDLGFDIVDEWTGISALTNLGYCKNDLDSVVTGYMLFY